MRIAPAPLALLAVLAAAPPAPAAALALRGARVFTGEEEIEGATVVVVDG